MDHRWDRQLEQGRDAAVEEERYGARRIEDDPDVERRDREIARQRRAQRSPWEIGAARWDQRDLYTSSARTDEGGYGTGPRVHPEVGSYAYRRDRLFPVSHEPPARLYAGEAWPWQRYESDPPFGPRAPAPPGTWDRLRSRVESAFGRGPKTWRSDARLLEDVSDALTEHDELDASDIEVAVKDAEVTLEGTVRDRTQKRLAEDLASACAGVRDVHNHLRIERDDDHLILAAPIRSF